MSLLSLLSLLCSWSLFTCAAGEEKPAEEPLLTVLFTTEIHGRLLPCDCPIQPLGGVARRATRIERYRRRGPVLVVDAGGWQAGGPYDTESDGDAQRDELRTQLMAQAMDRMSYDLICGGKGDPLAKPYAPSTGEVSRVNVSGRGIEVPLRLCAKDADACIWVRPPAGGEDGGQALRAPLIVLSRLEPEEITRLAAGFTEEALVITALPLGSQRGVWTSGKATLVGFDFQSEFLGVAEVFPATDRGRRFEIRVHADALTESVPDDAGVAALLEPHLRALKSRSKRRLEVECWIRPEQLATEAALADLARLAGQLGDRVSIAVRFHLPEEIETLRSLGARPVWAEAGLHAVVQRYYPEKYWAWYAWRKAHPAASWEEGAHELGLLGARVRGALAVGEPASLLRADRRLMVRRGLEAEEARAQCAVLRLQHAYGLPRLVIANRVYREKIDYAHVIRALCALLQAPKPPACDGVPACLSDAHCRKRGFIGRCIEPGRSGSRCDRSRPAVTVPAIVVVDEKCVYDNRQQVMEALVEDLPGVRFREVDFSTAEGKALVGKGNVARLPAYFLGAEAKHEVGFPDGLGKLARDAGGYLMLDGGEKVGAHRLVNRPRIAGRLDLFADRSTEAGRSAVRTSVQCLLADTGMAPEVGMRDVLLWKGEGGGRELSAPGKAAGFEEAVRAEVVRQLAPEKAFLYLKERARSEWEAAVRYAGLDPVKVRTEVERRPEQVLKALGESADLLKALGASGEVVLLVENCELIPVHTPRDIRDVFQRTVRDVKRGETGE